MVQLLNIKMLSFTGPLNAVLNCRKRSKMLKTASLLFVYCSTQITVLLSATEIKDYSFCFALFVVLDIINLNKFKGIKKELEKKKE